VVTELLIAGDQVPVKPLFEVVGKEKLPPIQIAGIWVKVAAGAAFTVTVIVVVVAHCPAAGVKVYVVVVVLLIAGDHVPVKLSLDVVGNVKLPPVQIGATCVNVGVTGAPTLTVIVVVVAH
jgi:hypothetical protein